MMNISDLIITHSVGYQELLDEMHDPPNGKQILDLWESVKHKKGVLSLIRVYQSVQTHWYGGDDPEDFRLYRFGFTLWVKKVIEMLLDPSFLFPFGKVKRR